MGNFREMLETRDRIPTPLWLMLRCLHAFHDVWHFSVPRSQSAVGIGLIVGRIMRFNGRGQGECEYDARYGDDSASVSSTSAICRVFGFAAIAVLGLDGLWQRCLQAVDCFVIVLNWLLAVGHLLVLAREDALTFSA